MTHARIFAKRAIDACPDQDMLERLFTEAQADALRHAARLAGSQIGPAILVSKALKAEADRLSHKLSGVPPHGELVKTLTDHAGDCTIYSSLLNNTPWDGICTCGFGWQRVRSGDHSKMLSAEKLSTVQPPPYNSYLPAQSGAPASSEPPAP